MNEMQCDEDKIEYIQDKTQALPQTMSEGQQTSSPPPPQRSKMSCIKGFGENISQLPLYVNVSHLDISLFHMISQEVVSHIEVFHSFMED
jgi:hypothetical protein